MLEPQQLYVHSWHIDAICTHLEAVTDGRITRLLINVPPGSMKSLLVSVLWPAWEWGPKGMRSMRYLTTAFNETPVKRDTRKCRDLILSEWYQALWPEVRLVRTGEMSFANASTGTREGIPFGSLTSQRADRLVIDDPHSTETAESPTERATTTRKFREGAINRLNDQVRSAIVVIMQRLHDEDVSGVILKLGMPFVHLMLPMEFEPERVKTTLIGFRDPRMVDGDLLDPVRFPREALAGLKHQMGSHAYAGQYQQRPVPREGGMFKLAWFADRIAEYTPNNIRWVRHWDLAASKKRGLGLTQACTAGVLIGQADDGLFYVGDVVRLQEEGPDVRRTIKATADLDGPEVMISLPQDPGQAGKVQVADMIMMLAGYDVRADSETGDKETRAEPFAAQCEAGNVRLVRGPWNDAYISELCLFPGGAQKDQVDASSGAFGRLIGGKRAQLSFG